ncbi:uncharacterized protein KGF55_000208 [Candida pseudojiufengensis]|uniref:uncharacterized protein n=1 Tax=Candida pseudojiufengensis TaxID=497109 RepID=UPI0022245870|nr:uncharacterized protein KGF55_000208 [Candida pseudojiufengensis]KAI5966799.1 hypothetical protein KGF55_000208 [Candida pseudojiufengensis]
MSSAKDYILKIEPTIDVNDEEAIKSTNILKFSLYHRKQSLLFRLKPLLMMLSLTLSVVFLILRRNSIFQLHQLDVFSLIILLLIMISFSSIQEPSDSLTIIKGVGAQLDSTKLWSFQNSNTFIPINNMIDLVIHEGFHGYGQVIFYLCFLCKSNLTDNEENDYDSNNEKNDNNEIIKIVFKEFLPRKDVLLKVRKLSRKVLFDEAQRYSARVIDENNQPEHII